MRLVLISILSFCISAAHADDVLDLVSFFHDPKDPIRTGIEIEFTGIKIEDAIRVVQKAIGGSVQYSDVPWMITVEDEKGVKKDIDIQFQKGELFDNKTGGPVTIKPEFNDTSGVTTLEKMYKKVIIEMLTAPGPIRFPGVVEFQKALDALKAEGAIGTRENVAVSLQVNVEIGEGKAENFKARDIVNLLRNYMRAEHRRQIMDRYKIPKVRLPYIQPLSPGFMARLMEPSYDPTLEQLKDDAIHRQLLDFLGDKKAWTKTAEEARRDSMKYIVEKDAFRSKNSPLFRVIKFSPLKIASLLLYAFPKDPLASLAVENLWIKLIPAIEFRDRNNDFDVISAVREAVGMLRASEAFGAFLYDPLIDPKQEFAFRKFTVRELEAIAKRADLGVQEVRYEMVRAALAGEEPRLPMTTMLEARSTKPDTVPKTIGGSCRAIFAKAM